MLRYGFHSFLKQFSSKKPTATILCNTLQYTDFSKITVYNLILRNISDKMADNRFGADYDKRGQASCKKCKQKIGKDNLRLAKITANPFTESEADMKLYFHPSCLFETFVRARATTKIIEDPSDIEGFSEVQDEHKAELRKLIKEIMDKKGKSPQKKKATPKKQQKQNTTVTQPTLNDIAGTSKVEMTKNDNEEEVAADMPSTSSDPVIEKDNSFRQFRRLCADIAEESSYLGKTKIVSEYLKKGNSGKGFQGDVYLLLKLLLPGFVKTVYNLNSKQLIKLFSQIFGADQDEMLEHLEQGDVAETVKVAFENSSKVTPQTKSSLSIQQVNCLLTELSQFSKEDDHQRVLLKMAKRSTANDLKMIVRLIKHDLRINAGAKHILEALDPNAYEAFQASRDLKDVVDRVQELRSGSNGQLSRKLSIKASLMTPVLPMLAEACKSVEQAFKRCPQGMYAEIKYDGERVQVHKQGTNFQYFSRSLKPVLPHKVQHFKDWIPKAFPGGSDLILDSEVLLIDTKTSKPLPFGSLGVHKKAQFADANVCLFVFDCIHYNGESLMNKTVKERKRILENNMTEIPNHIVFSEKYEITRPQQLRDLMARVFTEGLEGLVLKDYSSTYEPGKRHWLKVKKDYLAEGSMADSADLIVLGGYIGTGNKGGMMSTFLMGCYNPATDNFVTVTKCSGGFDDATLAKLQTVLDVVKIGKDFNKVPKWLQITRGVVPDFIVKDPKVAPVWEITGAEFTKAEIHTADGLSIRFPRCTKMRDDKAWKDATDLPRLKELFKLSKERSDFDDLLGASKSGSKASDALDSEITETNDDLDKPSTSQSPRKRKIKSDERTPVSSPKRLVHTDSSSKSSCKYGASCYQKNKDHLRQFSHPKISDPKGLPSVFHKVKFFLSPNLKDYRKLRRYVIAYDGEVVSDFEKSSAHYIVSDSPETEVSNGQKAASSSWLWNCIQKKKITSIRS